MSGARVSGFLRCEDAGRVEIVSIGRVLGRRCVRVRVAMPGKPVQALTLYGGDAVQLSMELDLEPLTGRENP